MLFCKGGGIQNMWGKLTSHPPSCLTSVSMHLFMVIHSQLSFWCFHFFPKMCVLFMSSMAPKWLKVVVRGVDETKEVRTARCLATTCIIALHQLWENRREKITRFYFATVSIINKKYCPYLNACLLLKHIKNTGGCFWDLWTSRRHLHAKWREYDFQFMNFEDMDTFYGTAYLCKVRDMCIMIPYKSFETVLMELWRVHCFIALVYPGMKSILPYHLVGTPN
jgi:hypothetical protein